jgi:hypothetical protein
MKCRALDPVRTVNMFHVFRVGFVRNMYRIWVAKNTLEGGVTWTVDGYEYTRMNLRKLVVRTQS